MLQTVFTRLIWGDLMMWTQYFSLFHLWDTRKPYGLKAEVKAGMGGKLVLVTFFSISCLQPESQSSNFFFLVTPSCNGWIVFVESPPSVALNTDQSANVYVPPSVLHCIKAKSFKQPLKNLHGHAAPTRVLWLTLTDDSCESTTTWMPNSL